MIVKYPDNPNNGAEGLSLEVLDDALSVARLLREETGGGDHGKAAVLELLNK